MNDLCENSKYSIYIYKKMNTFSEKLLNVDGSFFTNFISGNYCMLLTYGLIAKTKSVNMGRNRHVQPRAPQGVSAWAATRHDENNPIYKNRH